MSRVQQLADPEQALGQPEELAARLVDAIPVGNRWDERIGPVYTTAHLVKMLGISRQAVNDRTKSRALWGLKTADRQMVYPARQFGKQFEVIPELSNVLKAFRDTPVDDWTLASWLTSNQPDLQGRSIIDALANANHADAVIALRLAEITSHRWSH